MEITREKFIKVLQKELQITSQYNMFNEDKHEILREGIHALENNLSMDDVYDLELDSEMESNIIGYLEVLEDGMDIEDYLYEDISNYTDILEGKEAESEKGLDISNVKVCKKLCKDCPFSNSSLQGFLANYTTQDFVEFQRYDVAFPCHKTLSEEDLTVDSAKEKILKGEIMVCRGYTESIIKSAKKPIDPVMASVVEQVKEDGLSEESMNLFEFIKYHTVLESEN